MGVGQTIHKGLEQTIHQEQDGSFLDEISESRDSGSEKISVFAKAMTLDGSF